MRGPSPVFRPLRIISFCSLVFVVLLYVYYFSVPLPVNSSPPLFLSRGARKEEYLKQLEDELRQVSQSKPDPDQEVTVVKDNNVLILAPIFPP